MTERSQRGTITQHSTLASTSNSLGRGQFASTVIANVPLCRDHFRLTLQLPHFPPTFPGHFIQIACRHLELNYSPEREFEWNPEDRFDLPAQELQSPLALLRRPFSLAGRRNLPNGVELDIIHRIIGVGTDWLAHLQPEDRVDILGPLGNHFDVPPAGTQAILVGGGVGIPPMLYLAEALAGRSAVAFCGALTQDLLPLTISPSTSRPQNDAVEPIQNIAEFSLHGIPSVVTTDDGSFGFRGFVTQALERFLDRHPSPTTVIYTCGPELMMKRVAEIASARNIECQIAVERTMACGMGTCQSCVIRVRKPDPSQPPLAGSGWCYRLACTDGPVFRGSDLLW